MRGTKEEIRLKVVISKKNGNNSMNRQRDKKKDKRKQEWTQKENGNNL